MADNIRGKYGLGGIFQLYGWGSLLKDSIIPLILGLTIDVVIALCDNLDIYSLICEMLSMSMTVIPIIITLILTSYTIFLSLFTTNKQISGFRELNKTLKGITSTYAACLVISIGYLGFLFVFYIISKLGIDSIYASTTNYIVLLLTICFITYPFVVLINIIIDMFNSGKISLNISNLTDEQIKGIKEKLEKE